MHRAIPSIHRGRSEAFYLAANGGTGRRHRSDEPSHRRNYSEGAKLKTIEKRGGIKWPICTLLLVIGIGAMGYWTYSKYQEEQAVIAARPSAPAPATPGDITVGPIGRGTHSYRTGLPPALLFGFAAVMIAILGTILYLWWSLKDWEGGNKYGEDEDQKNEKPS